MAYQHENLFGGRWKKLSLIEQLANVGSEVGRAAKWQEKDAASYEASWRRALELIDLTMQDGRWKSRLKEVSRVREVLSGVVLGKNLYKTSLHDLERYFFNFAVAARLKR